VYDKSAQVCSVCVFVYEGVCVHIFGCECVCVGSTACVNGFIEGDIQLYGWGRCLYRTGLLMTNDFNVRLCYVAIP